MNSHILFTGLVRNEDLFIEKLTKAVQLKREGFIQSIIFSTWLGELIRYEKVKKFITLHNVFLIESTEPNVKLPGYILHQMKSLHLGLSLVPESDYVYKMRPDLGPFNIDNVKKIVTQKHPVDIDTDWPVVFKEKVVIDGGFIMHPFYMNDIQFFGLVSDLKKMVNFDLSYEVLFNDISPEQYFYISPFIEHFSILHKFFMVNQGLLHSQKEQAKKYMEYYSGSRFHLKVLATYILILDSYFHINGMNDARYEDEITLMDIFNGLVPDVSIYPSLPYAPAFKGSSWIKHLINYKGGDPLTIKLSSYLLMAKNMSFQKYISENLFEIDDAVEVKEALKTNFSNNRSKIPFKVNEQHYKVEGGSMRVTLVDNKNPLVKHLENQLNEAKRKYDEVCCELESLKNGKQ